MRIVTSTHLLFRVNVNRALSSRKCSIKAPAKCKTSVYVLHLIIYLFMFPLHIFSLISLVNNVIKDWELTFLVKILLKKIVNPAVLSYYIVLYFLIYEVPYLKRRSQIYYKVMGNYCNWRVKTSRGLPRGIFKLFLLKSLFLPHYIHTYLGPNRLLHWRQISIKT